MNEQAPLRIAVVDIDSGFLHVLGRRMAARSHDLVVYGSAVAVEELVAARVNAVVVNLAILRGEPFAYLERLCASLPVLVCTGRSSVEQRVRGLRLGADDWVTKPCHPEELIARVEAVMRRRMFAERAVEPVVAGELAIRGDHFQAYVRGESIELTRREFELIALLAAAEGRVLEREEIYQRVWGYAMARGDRSVDVFVRKLRQKLEKASPEWRYIHTHFGVGYRFAAERVAPVPPPPVPLLAPEPPERDASGPERDALGPERDTVGPERDAPHPEARALS
ncbi:MAG TPA: response regulator transcription factor [Solirubrobacteraceae bacterium]|nr:response regulator transcription factor [Solirubrobacteraceae bacterium]